MYVASCCWHGLILNDFSRLAYPKDFFLLFSAFAYLAIGALIAFFVQFLSVPEKLPRRGLLIGSITGLFLFLVAFVFGVSFNSNPEILHILTDFVWQIAEQTSGGWLCGLTVSYMSYLEANKEAENAF